MKLAEPINDKEKILQTIGESIRRLRKEKGWSQERLAAEADSDRTYISDIENAKHNPTIGFICELANAMEVEISELIEKAKV